MSGHINVHPEAFKERWVCYSDLLGFKNLVLNKNWINVFATYSKAVEIVANSRSYQDRVRYAWFSDSFIMYTIDGSFDSYAAIEQIARRFVFFLIKAYTPLRGSLAFGEYYADEENKVQFGKALVEAYEYGESQNWIGLIQCPSVVQKLTEYNLDVRSQLNYPFWRIPFKNDKFGEGMELPAYRIGEHMKSNGQNTCLNALKGMEAECEDPRIKVKYKNTIEFLEKNKLQLAAESDEQKPE